MNKSRQRSSGSVLATVLALFCIAASVRGNTIIFTTLSSYNAATTGNVTDNFTGIAAANNFVTETVPAGITIGGVNFTINTATSNGLLFVVDAGFANNFFGATILDSQFSNTTNDNLVITLPSPRTAVAFDFGSNNGSTDTFTLSNGDTFTRSTTGNVLQFVGLTSSTPFTTISITEPTGGALVLQDITIGSVSAVPLPSAFATGLVMLGGLLGWRLKRAWRTKAA